LSKALVESDLNDAKGGELLFAEICAKKRDRQAQAMQLIGYKKQARAFMTRLIANHSSPGHLSWQTEIQYIIQSPRHSVAGKPQ
jgi:hypothetical protein